MESSFRAAKGQVGLDEHEVRKWRSWYRHTTVCMLAMVFLVIVRSRLIPALPMTRPPTVNEMRRLCDGIVFAPARTWLAMH